MRGMAGQPSARKENEAGGGTEREHATMKEIEFWACWTAMAVGLTLYGVVRWRSGEAWRQRLDAWVTWGTWALVGAISLALVARHEPWRDELHAWVQARDMAFPQLWHEMRWEGHFITWHMLLRCFSTWGAPVWTLGAVSWALNWAVLAFFAKKAPFGAVEKAVAMLAVPFAYLNPVVSRCYVLVPPVLFGLAALWRKRDEWPMAFGVLVALLANTHLYLEGTAGLIALVFAWENVLRRADGKGWRECGRQWASLGVMATGMVFALVQVLPSLWDESRAMGWHCGWQADLLVFLDLSRTWGWKTAALAGGCWAGWAAWKRDKGVFWVYAGSVAYMVGFSVFLYSAAVMNRAVLWYVVFLWALWALGGKADARWRMAAMLAVGLALWRPDMLAAEWRWEFDPLPGACKFVAGKHGANAEVWIHGDELNLTGTRAYLTNLWDWRTGEKAERMCMSLASWKGDRPFVEAVREVFAKHPEKESVLVMGYPGGGSGLEWSDTEGDGVVVEYRGAASAFGTTGEVVVMRVERLDGSGTQ